MIRIALLLAGAIAVASAQPAPKVLRVCADPNNLPFSDAHGNGFENKIVAVLAADMGETVQYTWWAQRRGFARNTLKADSCDLWPGVTVGLQTLSSTRPYYRSSYVFVSRSDRHLNIRSFDDPHLQNLKIGVQMIGNNAQNTPPAHALARRGLIANVRGFMLYGDYTQPSPTAAIVDAVARGDIDIAVVWGPLAGYFAGQGSVALTLNPVEPLMDGPQWPMVFDIGMGVRRGEPDFKHAIEHALVRNSEAIDAILTQFHVPVIAEAD